MIKKLSKRIFFLIMISLSIVVLGIIILFAILNYRNTINTATIMMDRFINGGNITVAGPTSSGNGALDYDRECVVTGGNLIVYGAYGMWQNPSSNSTQYSLTFQTLGNSGDLVSLKDNSGTEIISLKTEKQY